jgi:hypothetical protein
MIQHDQIQPDKLDQPTDKSLRLAKAGGGAARRASALSQQPDWRRAPLPAGRRPACCTPAGNCILRQPQPDIATLDQSAFTVRPVLQPIHGLRCLMTTGLIELERHAKLYQVATNALMPSQAYRCTNAPRHGTAACRLRSASVSCPFPTRAKIQYLRAAASFGDPRQPMNEVQFRTLL